jgi:hypothetical protein
MMRPAQFGPSMWRAGCALILACGTWSGAFAADVTRERAGLRQQAAAAIRLRGAAMADHAATTRYLRERYVGKSIDFVMDDISRLAMPREYRLRMYTAEQKLHCVISRLTPSAELSIAFIFQYDEKKQVTDAGWFEDEKPAPP